MHLYISKVRHVYLPREHRQNIALSDSETAEAWATPQAKVNAKIGSIHSRAEGSDVRYSMIYQWIGESTTSTPSTL